MDWERLARFVLRAGVAFAFLYPPIDAWANPFDWIGYFPSWMHGVVPDLVLLHGFGLVEILIALWLLWGRRVFWPAASACALLLAIVAFNLPNFIIVFRDLSIAAAALAIALLEAPSEIARTASSRVG